jgi:outer membrane receptor protein involved in Fe transport
VASQNFEFGGFVQDNWKMNDKLTLNLGLRYEVVCRAPSAATN